MALDDTADDLAAVGICVIAFPGLLTSSLMIYCVVFTVLFAGAGSVSVTLLL